MECANDCPFVHKWSGPVEMSKIIKSVNIWYQMALKRCRSCLREQLFSRMKLQGQWSDWEYCPREEKLYLTKLQRRINNHPLFAKAI